MQHHETEISLRQRLIMKELEAQLYEAEDVVVNLREQLKEVEDKLNKMKEILFPEQIIKGFSASFEYLNHANKLKTSEAISSLKDGSRDQRRIGGSESENSTTPTKTSSPFSVENYSQGHPDLISIMMTSKEPELYRNRCTQRIQAFDRNHLDMKLAFPLDTDDLKSNNENTSTIKESATDKPKKLAENKWTRLEESLEQGNNSDKGLTGNFFRRFSMRKCKSRYRRAIVVPCDNQVMQSIAIFTRCKAYACPENNIPESGNPLSKITDQEVQKDSGSHVLISSLDNTVNDPLPGIMYEVNVQTAASEEIVSVDKSYLLRQGGKYAIAAGSPNFVCEWEPVDFQVINDGETIGAANSRLPRYSCKRKRKQGFLSWPDKNKCQESNTMKKRSGHIRILVLCASLNLA